MTTTGMGIPGLPRLASRAFAAVAIVALALPAIGSALDHHFAERLPGHAHIYLAGASPDHEHRLAADHPHDGATVVADDAGVVFMSAAAGDVTSSKQIVMDRAPAGVDSMRNGGGKPLAAPGGDHVLAQSLVVPEPPPPRT